MPESTELKVVAVIAARGGSKSVPRRNLVDVVAGRPLISRIIEAALASTRVLGSSSKTEDDEIAAVAGKWGAEPRSQVSPPAG